MSHIPGGQHYQVEIHFLDPEGQLTLELTTYVQGSRLCCFCLHPFPTSQSYKTTRDNSTFTSVHQPFPGQNHKHLNNFGLHSNLLS